MNKIHKVIFSRHLGIFIVASELTKTPSKSSTSSRNRHYLSQHMRRLRHLTIALLIGISPPTWAASSGFILSEGKLVYCPNITTEESSGEAICQEQTSPSSLSSEDNKTLNWNGEYGFQVGNNTKTWINQTGDIHLPFQNDPKAIAKLDRNGIHLGYESSTNIEKASFVLLNPKNSLKNFLLSGASPIFATANNGGWGSKETGTSAENGGTSKDNGYIFGSSSLGLLVGSLAEGTKSDFTGGTGQGFAVFLGFRNGVLDIKKHQMAKGSLLSLI